MDNALVWLLLTKAFFIIAIATMLLTATGGLYVLIIGFALAGWAFSWAKFFEYTS